MTDIHEIWKFVEKKMCVSFPPFIKYVLKFCGYENCHTISTIVEKDINEIELDVQKGGIIEFYKGEVLEADVLKGSVTGIKDFKIKRGHRQLLLAAAKLVKDRLAENGVEEFSAASPKRKNKRKTARTVESTAPAPAQGNTEEKAPKLKLCKKPKLSPVELLTESMLESLDEELSERADQFGDPHMTHHKHCLLMKGLSLLKLHNSVMYVESNINKKFTENSVILNKKTTDGQQYAARLECPFCEEKITVFHKLSTSEYGSWNASNFERHLTLTHKDLHKPYDDISRKTEKAKFDSKSVGGAKALKNLKDEVTLDVPFAESTLLSIKSDKQAVNGSETAFKLDEPENDPFGSTIKETDQTMPIKASVKIPIELQTKNEIVNGAGAIVSLESYPATEDIDFTFIIVPSATGKDEVKVIDDNVMIEDFSVCGSLSDSSSLIEIQTKIEERLIFPNGAHTHDEDERNLINTINTCGFDSILEVYAAIYFDHKNYREFLDVSHIFLHCDFTALLHAYFVTNSRTPKLQISQIQSAWDSMKRSRNIILKNVFSSNYYIKLPNLKKDNRFTHIDCLTGLGEFFAQLTYQNQILSSAIESKTCQSCKITTTKIVPYLSIDGNDLKLNNIQLSIDKNNEKIRCCSSCKMKVTFKRVLNRILAIDIESSRDIQNNTKISLEHLSRTIKPDPETEYKLCAVIEFNPMLRHFTAVVKRINGQWTIFDDLKMCGTKLDEKKELFPFMLFYLAETAENKENTFKKAFISKVAILHFLTSYLQICSTEPKSYEDVKAAGGVGTAAPVTSSIFSSSKQGSKQLTSSESDLKSNSSNNEWKKARENGWRY